MKTNRGFTLIELVVVIVILGILAATALPKFVDLGQDARASAMEGVQGAMQAANTMIYAKASVANPPRVGVASSAVTIGSSAVGTAYGYAKDVTELAKAMDLSGDFTVGTSTTNTITHSKAPNAAKCVIKYTAATSATAAPSYTTGTDMTCGS